MMGDSKPGYFILEKKIKLYDLEITPPPGVWEKVTAELDEADLVYKYPAALYKLAADPPDDVWTKITAHLDTPPYTSTSEKLIALEISPPVTAWNAIKISLDAEKEAAIPVYKRLSPLFFRYAAAAVIIGLLTWGGLSLISNKSSGPSMATQENPVIPAATFTPKTSAETATIATTDAAENIETAFLNGTDEARNDAALEASKKTYARLDFTANSKIKQAANFYFALGNSRNIDITADNHTDNILPAAATEADRYILLMTPDGNIIRMSKKLSNLLCCVAGEEQDKECKDQMRKWREKIACSPSSHSPGNFMDILNLASILQEENEL